MYLLDCKCSVVEMKEFDSRKKVIEEEEEEKEMAHLD